MIIRPASASDGQRIMQLVTSILSKEFPSERAVYATDDLEHLEQSYPAPSSVFLVAEEDSRIVGTCGVKAESSETAILRRLFVDPSYRRRKVGYRLLEAALAFARAQGFREVVIRTSTRMEGAIRLCKSLGFQEDGTWTLGQVTLVRFLLRLK